MTTRVTDRARGALAALDGFWDEPRIAVLATLRADGTPHLTPVKAMRDGDDLLVLTRRATVKARNAAARPAVSVAEHGSASWATVEGRATVSEDPADLARARGAYRRRFGEPDRFGDCVLIVHPTRLLSGS